MIIMWHAIRGSIAQYKQHLGKISVEVNYVQWSGLCTNPRVKSLNIRMWKATLWPWSIEIKIPECMILRSNQYLGIYLFISLIYFIISILQSESVMHRKN